MIDLRETPPLPPAPSPEEPTRKRLPQWLWIVGALVVGLAILIGFTDGSGASTAQPAAADEVACVNLDESTNLTESAMAHLTQSKDYVMAFDLDSAADEMDGASADLTRTADLWSDYPTVSTDATAAADYLGDAATALRAGDLTGSTTSLNASASEIDNMTDDVTAVASDVVPC